MYSSRFRKIFFLRFLSYFLIFSGLIFLALNLEPVIGEEGRYIFNGILGKKFIVADVKTSKGTLDQGQVDTLGGVLTANGSEIILPKDTNFGIVIEKIDANSKVIPDVDPGNAKEYDKALLEGVAQARGSSFPGQKGNIYLFSHSVGSSWSVVRYNAVFYLLNQLVAGDRIVLFYQGRRYDYIVFDKTVVKPSDTHFLTDPYQDSVLTLQTCDPPGTLLNRLIIRAKLGSDKIN